MADPMAEASTIVLGPGEGRSYEMPDMRAVFKADGHETDDRYCVSEWWVKPGGSGPGAHMHAANDEIFYGIAGTMSLLAGDVWHDLAPGGFLRIPAGVVHDFRNPTSEPAGVLNVFIPGGFERDMPAILEWFEETG